jgi:CubicO group peptidase (beta-lactamase class C family)
MRSSAKLPIVIILISILGPLSTLAESAPKKRDYWPTKEWKTIKPEQAGVDSKRLEKLRHFIERDQTTKGAIVIRNGYIVGEWYFRGFDKNQGHRSASVAKSFTSAIVGKAIAEGKLKGPKQKVGDIHPSAKKFKDLTLENLLSMSSGFNWRNFRDKIEIRLYSSYIEFIMTRHIQQQPGTKFQYKPVDPNFLSVIVQHVTGKSLKEYGMETLFKPIGISKFDWRGDPKGTTNGAAGITMKTRDYARFGYLFLNNGHWDGKQLLPEKWVKRSTTFAAKGNKSYGYLWWHKRAKAPVPSDTYSARGKYGQRIIIIPSLDMVVIRVGDEFKQRKEVWDQQFLKLAVESALKTPAKAPIAPKEAKKANK